MINLVTALALMGAVVLCAGCALCAVIMYGAKSENDD